MDMVSTIGESAALGAAGAIFWGDAEDTRSRVCVIFCLFSCTDTRPFLASFPWISEINLFDIFPCQECVGSCLEAGSIKVLHLSF